MAIFHLSMKIIGGGSGRTAIGAAAYRRGEKLHSEHDGTTHDYTSRRSTVSAAAYHRGDELNDGNITHDFTKKRGIAYSEIILPKHASQEYLNSQTLWNAAQNAEKQHNARTAKEIVVALPNELTTEQQINLVRDYVQRNFVDKGMCADFSIHSGHIHEKKGEIYPFQDLTVRKDNPHAHIMLTVRPINKDGTWGAKSKKEYILDKNGERIKLKSGEWKSRKIDTTDWDKTETLLKWRENWAVTVNKEFERLGIDERISHLSLKEQGIDREPTNHMGHEAWNLEKKGIKTKIGNKNRATMAQNKARNIENIAKYIHELKEGYIILDKKVAELKETADKAKREINVLNVKAEKISERTRQINSMEKKLDELKTERQEMGLFKSKNAIDQQIQRLERSYKQAYDYFKQRHNITPEQAAEEVKRLECDLESKKHIHGELLDKLTPLVEEKEEFAFEYRCQKLLLEISPDMEKIQDRLKQLDKESLQIQTPKEKIARANSERMLNMVSERNFQEILKELKPEQAKALFERRERERERELIRGIVRER